MSYTSAEMQSVYSIAPADWVRDIYQVLIKKYFVLFICS